MPHTGKYIYKAIFVVLRDKETTISTQVRVREFRAKSVKKINQKDLIKNQLGTSCSWIIN